jgi:Major Facilitator Superfamily
MAVAFSRKLNKFGRLDGFVNVLFFFYEQVEAIPTLIMALVILLFLPSFPFSATFLTPRERAIAQARVNKDHRPTSHGGMNGWQGFKAVLSDPNAWLLMTIYTSGESCYIIVDHTVTSWDQGSVGISAVIYFLPTLIKGFGFSPINTQGLSAAPYVVGWFIGVFQALHSDRTRDRGWHIIASAFITFAGYVILATSAQKSIWAGYFALFLVIGGGFSFFPLLM